MPHTPLILVGKSKIPIALFFFYICIDFCGLGTKNDLREVDDPNLQLVSVKDAKKLGRAIRAECYLECSAQRLTGLDEIVTQAVRASVKSQKRTPKQNSNCKLL